MKFYQKLKIIFNAVLINILFIIIMKNNRCNYLIFNKKNRKFRKCKRLKILNDCYCKQHSKKLNNLMLKNYCFDCGTEIKIDSQICGLCARQLI